MLLTKDLINKAESKYAEMLSKVNIPNFTKCIAQFSGIPMKEIKDSVIEEYLLIWAESKYKFFEFLGNKLQLDMPIEYVNMIVDKKNDYRELEKQYPAYAPWLDAFAYCPNNKIQNTYNVSYHIMDIVAALFPHYSFYNSTITKFFRDKLNAPESLVTAIGRMYENDTIKGTYTISIDPVDMMLASETPYGWTSCYKLQVPNDCSHADGCLAAILDSSSLITYIWNREGDFKLYDYNLINIRYKRIRGWISIAPNFRGIHFNKLYPAGADYPEEFIKQLRYMVEEVADNYLGVHNIWHRNRNEMMNLIYFMGEYGYGYYEYSADKIYFADDETENKAYEDDYWWTVFDHYIPCPCSCGNSLPGSLESENTSEDHYVYNGDGFRYENYDYQEGLYYCEYADDYCSIEQDSDDCRACCYWQSNHPVCSLDNNHRCENATMHLNDVSNGIIYPDEYSCDGCPLYKLHHQDEEE